MGEHTHAALPVLPSRIPRFIGNLNSLAAQAGLAVTMKIAPELRGDNGAHRLWSEWRGSRGDFIKFVQPVRSYHLPLSQGWLNIPGGAGYYESNAIVSGQVTVLGDEVLFAIDFGSPDFSIGEAAGVEIVSYADETLYHGDPPSLIALGIERSRLPLQKKPVRSHRDWEAKTENWRSRRQPDGSVVHRVESPSALRQRRAQHAKFLASEKRQMMFGSSPVTKEPAVPRAYLRLVVDNEVHE